VRKAGKSKPVRDARIEAVQLLGRWTRIAQGHILVGGGCSCGVAAASLRIEDFEQQIMDYLKGKHAIAAESASVADLLRAMAGQRPGAGAGEALALLADLDRTLESFDTLHGAR
jgi:hypothetical protein